VPKRISDEARIATFFYTAPLDVAESVLRICQGIMRDRVAPKRQKTRVEKAVHATLREMEADPVLGRTAKAALREDSGSK